MYAKVKSLLLKVFGTSKNEQKSESKYGVLVAMKRVVDAYGPKVRFVFSNEAHTDFKSADATILDGDVITFLNTGFGAEIDPHLVGRGVTVNLTDYIGRRTVLEMF